METSALDTDETNFSTPSPSVRLSKTSIASLEQCDKKFWLRLHHPKLGRWTETTLRVFATGHLIGELARLCYPTGTLVKHDHTDLPAAISQTRSLLNRTDPQPIFEGAFFHRSVVIRADILVPASDGSWEIFEVKNSGGVRPAYISDLASQTWVMHGTGLRLSGIYIRHPVKPLRPWGRAHPISFIDVDVARSVMRAVAGKDDTVRHGIEVATSAMPEVRMGAQCSKPYRCEFVEHCMQLPDDA